MSRKAKKILAVYAVAAIAVLMVYSAVSFSHLSFSRQGAEYSSRRAFEQSVSSIGNMSQGLRKCMYATDGAMCAKLCAEVYADAQAAQTALSLLPFENYRLEQVSGFIATAGDYAHSLCSSAASDGFTRDELENLTKLSQSCGEMAETVKAMQQGLYNGDLLMDAIEQSPRNVGLAEQSTVGAALLEYDGGLEPLNLSYDGKFSAKAETESDSGESGDLKALAAQFLGVEASSLREAAEWESESNACFKTGDSYICVGPGGVESLISSRLIGESAIDQDTARQAAEEFLLSRGFEGYSLESSESLLNTCRFRFSCESAGAACLDGEICVTVAMDDGTVCGFERCQGGDELGDDSYALTETQAEMLLPPNLTLQSLRRAAIQSPGGTRLACYELSCTDENGAQVLIYVDGVTGEQKDIVL